MLIGSKFLDGCPYVIMGEGISGLEEFGVGGVWDDGRVLWWGKEGFG